MAILGIHRHCKFANCMSQTVSLPCWYTLIVVFLAVAPCNSFSAFEISRHVRWIDDLIKEKHAQEFYSQSRKNYSKVAYFPSYDSLFALSDNALLTQLQSESLEYVDQYVVPVRSTPLCRGMDRECDETRDLILLGKVRLTDRQEAPLLCYSYGLVYLGNRLRGNPPLPTRCFVPQANMHNRIPLNDLKLDEHIDAEFLKDAVSMSTSNNFLFLAGRKGNHARVTRLPITSSQQTNPSPLILRTKDESNALSEWVRFITAFEANDAVYFVILEKERVSMCHAHQGASHYYTTRLLRVCSNDMGGIRQMMDENNFGTLAKADLQCRVKDVSSENRDLDSSPYSYKMAADANWNKELQMLTVLYHSERAGPKGSAVCFFKLTNMEEAFSGQSFSSDSVDPIPNVCSKLMNPASGLTEEQLLSMRLFSTRYPHRKHSIRPYLGRPLLVEEGNLWQRITVHTISTVHTAAVVYIVPEDRRSVLSVAISFNEVNPIITTTTKSVCLYDALYLRQATERITDMTLVDNGKTPNMVLSTNRRLVQIPLTQCAAKEMPSATSPKLNQETCLSNPFCVWYGRDRRCYHLSRFGDDKSFLTTGHYEGFKCKASDVAQVEIQHVRDLALAGHWFMCHWGDMEKHNCICRSINGELMVKNCSVNGGWTEWSPWSTCSGGCNIGIRERTRSCVNPRPMYNGKPCPATDKYREVEACEGGTEVCHSDSPWLANNHEYGWDPWSPWSPCSHRCGPGTQRSTRKCSHQKMCVGKDIRLRECYGIQCPEMIENSAWTPWLKKVGSFSEDHLIRLKFQCHQDRGENDQGSRLIVEEKLCTKPEHGSCTPIFVADEGQWTSWSSWSSCNRSCDGGMQTRNRTCLSQWCNGISEVITSCNMQSCDTNSHWLSWSEWSPCIGPCSQIGYQHRERRCLPLAVCEKPYQTEKRTCYTEVCLEDQPAAVAQKHWDVWSSWSSCDSGFRSRRRDCILCSGTNQDIQKCDRGSSFSAIASTQTSLNSSWWLTTLVLIGCAAGGVVMAYILIRLYAKLSGRCRVESRGPESRVMQESAGNTSKRYAQSQAASKSLIPSNQNVSSKEEETNLDIKDSPQRVLPNKMLITAWDEHRQLSSTHTYSTCGNLYEGQSTVTTCLSSRGGRQRLSTPPQSSRKPLALPPRAPKTASRTNTCPPSSPSNGSRIFFPDAMHTP